MHIVAHKAMSLMSRRTRKDYKRVLKAIKKKMPTRGAHLKQVVVDYEVALCQAVRDVFGDSVDVKGCVSSDGALQSYVRKLLALPFLPAEHVESTFQKLQSRATLGPLTELCSYINTIGVLDTCRLVGVRQEYQDEQ